jgi:hypothetical protein
VRGCEYSLISSLIDKSYDFTKSKEQTSQKTKPFPLSFLKGKKETKNPSTNPNKGQISF